MLHQLSSSRRSTLSFNTFRVPTKKAGVTSQNGPNQADGAQVDGRQGSAQAAGHQGGAQVGSVNGWRQERAPLPPGHGGSARDPSLPEVDRAADAQAALPAAGARDRGRLQK